jgi:thiamine pyrophosphate-dependent acetolactate synthase large subunit-like protein
MIDRMKRVEAMDVIAAHRGDAVAITGPGANSGLLYEKADRPATIYNMEMGYAPAIGLGLALACPNRSVLIIEGEGSSYAGSTVLSSIWRARPDNLVVVVLDNGVWGTGGGQEEPTATAFGLDLAGLARATGWDGKHVHSPSGANELGHVLASALRGGGPHFIVCKTRPDKPAPSRPRPRRHQLDCAVLMRTHLRGDR